MRHGFPYTPLDFAIGARFHRRLVPILLRAGATPRAHTDSYFFRGYIRKVITAGGFGDYRRTHLNALAATFAPHFAHHLPPEMVPRRQVRLPPRLLLSKTSTHHIFKDQTFWRSEVSPCH